MKKRREAKVCLGFRFTPQEERRMRSAMLDAALYMEERTASPAKRDILMVDRRKYFSAPRPIAQDT